jgi:hypothetical protein
MIASCVLDRSQANPLIPSFSLSREITRHNDKENACGSFIQFEVTVQTAYALSSCQDEPD